MTDPVLKDPRALYYESEFPKQDQEIPALQKKMKPVPDCGEESYVGHERLLNRRVLITGGNSGIGRAAAIAYAREGADIAWQFYPGEEPDAKQVAKVCGKSGAQSRLTTLADRVQHYHDHLGASVQSKWSSLGLRGNEGRDCQLHGGISQTVEQKRHSGHRCRTGTDLDSLATRQRPTGRKITGLRARLFNGAGRTAGRISVSLCFLSLQRSQLRNRSNLRGNRWRSNQLIERS